MPNDQGAERRARGAPPGAVLLLAAALLPAVPAAAQRFPRPDRPVSAIVSDQWSDEGSRDNAGEAVRVLRLAGVRPGMRVADIGAGAGYYVRYLSPAVGPRGRVWAQDIVPNYVNRLRLRASRAGLRNVSVVLGLADDPRLPAGQVDLALMVHMYHEIESPFALLWRLRASLAPGGRVVVVDADRPTDEHGTPPALLRCEMAAVGFSQTAFHRMGDGYFAMFAPTGPRPDPAAIRPCAAPRQAGAALPPAAAVAADGPVLPRMLRRMWHRLCVALRDEHRCA